MQTKFKRHSMVKILNVPDSETLEYNFEDNDEADKVEIKKGMHGKINVILPNGKYHVEILDKSGKVIAYAAFDEDSLEAI